MRTQNLKFTFHVMDKGDTSVGIQPTYEKVNIEVEYGFYDEFTESEFEKAMKEFLHDFYEECRCTVLNDNEYNDMIKSEREEEEYCDKIEKEYSEYMSANEQDLKEIEAERQCEKYAIELGMTIEEYENAAIQQAENIADGE